MKRVDPSLLEGEELRRWYLRTPDEIEGERATERLRQFNEFFGRQGEAPSTSPRTAAEDSTDHDGRWEDARVAVRPPPVVAARPALPSPSGATVGIPNDAGGIFVSAPRGGFFDTHPVADHPVLGPAYLTNLPRPLNAVTPQQGGWFELGDGTLVKGDEVERIHAEQQRRMRGEEDAPLAATMQTADRLQDGFVPRADQLAKGQREKDATCHPDGGWERDFGRKSDRSRDYERQIAGTSDFDYVVRIPDQKPVKFDGCAVWDPRHQLLEAKGPGYEPLIESARKSTFFGFLSAGTKSQARRQAGVGGERPVDWHIAEPGAVPYFADALRPYPSLSLRQTSPK